MNETNINPAETANNVLTPAQELDALRTQNQQLTQQVADLQAKVKDLEAKLKDLEAKLAQANKWSLESYNEADRLRSVLAAIATLAQAIK